MYDGYEMYDGDKMYDGDEMYGGDGSILLSSSYRHIIRLLCLQYIGLYFKNSIMYRPKTIKDINANYSIIGLQYKKHYRQDSCFYRGEGGAGRSFSTNIIQI